MPILWAAAREGQHGPNEDAQEAEALGLEGDVLMVGEPGIKEMQLWAGRGAFWKGREGAQHSDHGRTAKSRERKDGADAEEGAASEEWA